MRNRKLLFMKLVTIIMFISLFLVGCSTSKKAPEKRVGEEQNKKEIPPQTGENVEDRERIDDNNIPETLDDIEDDAKDIAEDIAKEDWTKANERLSYIERNWSTYESMAKEAKASQDQINTFKDGLNDLKKQIRDKKPYEASLSANRLAIASMDFIKLYEKKDLVDLEKIELYGEQILLAAKHDDWKQAKLELKLAVEIWSGIKTEADRINSNNTKKVSDTMTKISGAIDVKDARKVKELYKVLDDELDILEDDFKK